MPTSSARAVGRQQPDVGPLFDPGEAEAGGRVQAGPEGHPGVERDHHVLRPAPMAPPGGADDDAAPDPEHGEVLLPGIRPVGLVDHRHPQVADRPQPEGLQMAECGPGALDRATGGRRVAAGQVRPHRGRPRRVQARRQALVHQLETGFHARPAGAHTGSGSR